MVPIPRRFGVGPLLQKTQPSPMMYRILQRTGLFVLAVLLMSPTALAQENNAPNDDISADEVERVAEALIDIEDVRTTYQKKIRGADDQEQVRAYQRQMKMKMDQAIEDTDGLTIERYEEITQAAQADDELKQKILSMVKEKRKKQASR